MTESDPSHSHRRSARALLWFELSARIVALAVAIALAIIAAGCTDFATASELSRHQIVAVKSEPATVAPGERAQLQVLVAGPAGPAVADARWSVVGAPAATIATEPDGTSWLEVSAQAADRPVTVTVEVTVPGGETPLVAERTVGVGATAPNPEITGLLVAGAAHSGDAPITVTPGDLVDLDVVTEPAPPASARVTWYSTVGEIDRYRLSPTELELGADSAGDRGWLVVVYRDGTGGVTWQARPVTVSTPDRAGVDTDEAP